MYADESFSTVRAPSDPFEDPHRSPPYSNSPSVNLQQSLNSSRNNLHGKLIVSRQFDEDQSPRFYSSFNHGTNYQDKQNACPNVPHRKIRKQGYNIQQESFKRQKKYKLRSQSIQRLNELPRETLVHMLIDSRKEVQCLQNEADQLKDKCEHLSRICQELVTENAFFNQKNKQLELNQNNFDSNQSHREHRFKYKRSGTTPSDASPFRTRYSTLQQPSAEEVLSTTDKESDRVNLNAKTKAIFEEEVLKTTNTDSLSEALTRVQSFKQTSKFVCSLYGLIDHYTQNKYFAQQYSLSSAWSFVNKVFNEYFDENWIKSNSVVAQLQQVLNAQRDELVDRVMNLMRDKTLVNKVVEQFKFRTGLFWIKDTGELHQYLTKNADS